ncbi:MAG: portal protein, partial [Candidatus Brocadiales bacterium]|nr:portal protein [Candidatus Brocadiales bacterium]
MPMQLFGLTIGKKNPVKSQDSNKEESFVAPDSYDGTYTLETGGVFGTLIDFTGSVRDENALIAKYRSLAMMPEVDQAIEDIVNESIVMDKDQKPVKLDLEQTDLSDNIKKKIYSEYDGLLRLLKFHKRGVDLFRQWYIDSKLYYHIVLDKDNPQKGIKELRSIDPVKIKKIRKVLKDRPSGTNQVPFIKNIEEFYIYTDTDKTSTYSTPTSGIKIAPDSICYSHSGVIDMTSKRVVGYL